MSCLNKEDPRDKTKSTSMVLVSILKVLLMVMESLLQKQPLILWMMLLREKLMLTVTMK